MKRSLIIKSNKMKENKIFFQYNAEIYEFSSSSITPVKKDENSD